MKIQGDFGLDVCAASGASGTFASEEVAESEHVSKSIKDIFDVTEPGASGRSGSNSGVSMTVVACPFFGVAEDFVGFGQLLESFGGFIIARVAVGMKLDGQFSICGRQIAFGGGPIDPENFVIIAFSHGLDSDDFFRRVAGNANWPSQTQPSTMARTGTVADGFPTIGWELKSGPLGRFIEWPALWGKDIAVRKTHCKKRIAKNASQKRSGAGPW